jgi:hypothetical protein
MVFIVNSTWGVAMSKMLLNAVFVVLGVTFFQAACSERQILASQRLAQREADTPRQVLGDPSLPIVDWAKLKDETPIQDMTY